MRLRMTALIACLAAASGIQIPAAAQLTEKAKLLAGDGAAGDALANSLRIDGEWLVAGSPLHDLPAKANAGAAYVFRFVAGTWVEAQKLAPSDLAAGDTFGVGTALRGDRLVAGTGAHDGVASNSGAAWIYQFDGTNWVFEQKITASDASADDFFGNQVAFDGTHLAVSAFGDDDKGSQSGSIYLFCHNGTQWVEVQKLTAGDGAAGDQFGLDLDIEGDLLIASAARDDDDGSRSGSAYVFRFNGSTWSEEQKLTASDAAAGDEFGVRSRTDGTRIVVGARFANSASSADTGASYVFAHNGTSWVEQQKLNATDASTGDWFGFGAAIAGDTIVLGASFGDSATAADSGAAYIFEFNGTSWVESEKITQTDPAAQDRFGEWVGFNQGSLAVAARHDDDNGTDSGSVYVFELENEASDSVVLSLNSVWLRQNSTVLSGNVIVTDASPGPTLASGVELTVGVSADIAAGSELKADSIKVKQNAVVDGDVFYNDLDNGGTINSSLNSPLDLPVTGLPPFESAPAGVLDVLVPQNGFTTLTPGDYGEIKVKKKGKLVFLGGEYNVRSIDAGQACELLFSDVSTVRIEERFDTDKDTVIGPDATASIDASDIVFYVAGINGNSGNLGATPKAAQIGLNNTANANFHVPNGTLWIRQNAEVTGAFVGKDVILGIGASVAHDSAF